MQSSRFRPKSPDCRAIIEVNEESEDEEYEDEEYEDEYHWLDSCNVWQLSPLFRAMSMYTSLSSSMRYPLDFDI